MHDRHRAGLLGILGIFLFFPLGIAGHPLGNFSLNHYTMIDLQPGELISQHVLDFAEIPSFNELAHLDTNGDNLVSPEEMSLYKKTRLDGFLANFAFAFTEDNQKAISLEPEIINRDVVLSQGQGALTCLQLRFTCAFRQPVWRNAGKKRFLFTDNHETFIGGIREIRIRIHPGVDLQPEDIRTREPSAPVSIGNNTFYFKGLDADVQFSLTEEKQPPQERTIADFAAFIDPRSIPIYPLNPDKNGNFTIVKSPIQPDMEVQERISSLQPRDAVNASDLLNDAPPFANHSGSVSSSSSPVIARNSHYDRSGARDADWAAMIASDRLSPGIIILAIFVSLIAGASHALSPGHGKTVVAAYLVGSRGTIWDAVFLGIVVTITHVSSVLLLGVVTLGFYQYVVPERLNPILESFSGLLIVVIGATIFIRRFGAYQRKIALKSIEIFSTHDRHHEHKHEDSEHTHNHDSEHSHPHPHPHGHSHFHERIDDGHDPGHDREHSPHTHTHEIPADANWRDLLVLGITGGIVPCPAALLVLLSAIALHRLLFGMLLIVFFSIGLATVLIVIGVLMVSAKQLIDRYMKNEDSFAWLQIASPVLVTVLGLVIFIRGLHVGGYISFNF